MDLEQFRREAHRLVDWMADYLATIEHRPVRAQVQPGEVVAQLPGEAPVGAEPFDAIMADFERIVLPGITHWQHPRFMAYFPANASPPSVLAEMLTATIAAQCMLWQTSPAATELESRVLDWVRRLIGLPEGFAGVIQDSASSATLCAVLVARERATGWQADRAGLRTVPPLAVYASEQAHSSVEKAVRIAGLGREGLRLVPTDAAFAMRPDALEAAIRADRAAGIVPACVVASLGTTGVGACDPLAAVGTICREQGVYLHVDAAWAGSALLCPEQHWMIEGIENVDSFVFNPHKWLFTNFDCSAHFVRDPEALVRTLTVMPSYLVGRETGQVIDYRDWGIPLGRRFRALKLWFVLRSYGVERLQAMLRRHMAWAKELADWIAADPDFELVTGPNLALLSFRWQPHGIENEAVLDGLNERLLHAINDDGRLYLTQNRLKGRYTIRVSVGGTWTERRHVEEAWALIREIAARLRP
ncbi:pyridoxal phosphate-dependent decarboxylase family protein [Benzoatithermus flavus]|uniref:Pyridoxal-dependent decarboxylase n=1 Tax=Benzoatithermus flavus TaxID=3108223 RepID=A0ABU8XVU8_9PROT